MKLTELAITKKTISWMIVVLLVVGGIFSFNGLGRLEDPNFTLKNAIIVTQYPGASSLEVEEEVTLPIENAIQQLPYVDHVTSISSAGMSQVQVEMKPIYRKVELAQIWDEMRRKVNDMSEQLPPGSYPPIINDDFSDVFGVFYAITGEGFTYEDLANYTDFLRRELVLVGGVGKVVVGGRLEEQVFVEIERAKLASSGFSADTIRTLFQGQGLVTDAGNIQVGSEYLRISTIVEDGDGLAELKNLILGSRDGQLIYLSDVANLSKGYKDPPRHLYRFNARSALTLGISFADNVNVVSVGERINKRLAELEYARPLGITVNAIYDQPYQVKTSVDNFLIGLAQAVAIVIVVLMFAMGWRPGLIMSAILLLTIAGTFIVMNIYTINLHRISLGALIIALGMLVDNAIVITEGLMINMQRGMSRLESAIRIVSHARWPLLGATAIAIVAFAPIGLSPDATGEFTGSLFWVLFISLFFSWILAVTLTPFFCFLLFKEKQIKKIPNETDSDPYGGVVYRVYRRLLHACLTFRVATSVAMFVLLISALIAFGQVRQAFFPDSSLPMFMVDYWLPEGTSIHQTQADIQSIENLLLKDASIKKVTSTIGGGAARFMLTYAPENSYASYAQLLVEAQSYDKVSDIVDHMEVLLAEEYPQAFVRFKQVSVGPTTAAKIEARLIGPDAKVLRQLADEVITLFRANPDSVNVRQDWRERSKVVRPVFNSAAAKRFGISQADLDDAIKENVTGQNVGVFRHGSQVLPIILRPPVQERQGVENLKQIQVFSPVLGTYIHIDEFVDRIDIDWEDPLIKRRDRKRTLSVLADPGENSNTFLLFESLRESVEKVQLPQGYHLQWGGEYEAQQKANKAIFNFLPIGLLVMVVITVVMFNSIRQTLVIWITVPLAIIGVAYGLLLTGSPFSFTALLAVLSLIGMQIKNGIVLVEEIKRLNEEEGQNWHDSISNAAISRLRPVSMAAITTILGMIPLLSDVFFQPMAVTIMFGLGFATVLTLFVVPVLFALFYRVVEE